ncbi:tyrosine--tRNA ligase, partial [Acinetobacter baumannii]
MQGYDSVMMETDVEIGGTEQLFNMNMGRDMQRMWNQSPQAVITLPILRGTDGVRRMGKSLGNYIGINEVPSEMYAKVMSIPDDLMREWFA